MTLDYQHILSTLKCHQSRSWGEPWSIALRRPNTIGVELSDQAHQRALRGIAELRALLFEQNFCDKYVEEQVKLAKNGDIPRIQKIVDKYIFRLKVDEVRSTFTSDSVNIKQEAKRLKKLEFESRKYDLTNESELLDLTKVIIEKNDALKQSYENAQKKIKTTKEKAIQKLEELRIEFEILSDSPELLQAMELWGRSRNAEGDKNNGLGYHAGVVHYFEYRAYPSKNKRFLNSPLKNFSIQGFMDLTASFRETLRPSQNSKITLITNGLIFEDENKNQRVVIVTPSYLAIAFKHEGEPLRLLTVITLKPAWSTRERQMQRIKDEILNGIGENRFNLLGKERSLVSALLS